MRVLYLSTLDTVIVDIIAWIVLHLSIGYLCSKIPAAWFNPGSWLYQTFKWEKDGRIYQRFFNVRSWKSHIPSGGSLYPNTFLIQNIQSLDLTYLRRWLVESCRAEFCHWVMMLPGFLFFLWNSIELGWAMVAYAILNNLVPIISQRFNRPRIRKMIAVLSRIPSRASELVRDEKEEVLVNNYC
jgi:glycosyl-4,4'-diaponeurosporenoate acyltransferase